MRYLNQKPLNIDRDGNKKIGSVENVEDSLTRVDS